MSEIIKAKKRVVVFVLGTIFFLAWIAALFFVIRDTFFENYAGEDGRTRTTDSLFLAGGFSGRKNIYDRRFNELAVTFKLTSVYARPLEISEPTKVADNLATLLGLDQKELLLKLKSERSFVWLGQHISREMAEEVIKLKISGVYLIDEARRFYPNGDMASHAIGFLKDAQGLAGVESYYDSLLRDSQVDDHSSDSGFPGENESHLVLTIGLRMQELLEKELHSLMAKTGAATGMAMVMDVNDGSVLGMVNLPSYDPNVFWNYEASVRQNRIVSDPILPGGIGRMFRLAAAYDFEKGPGERGVADDRQMIADRNWVKLHDNIYVSPELAWFDEAAASETELNDFADRMGFNQKSGIDLPEAVSPNVSKVDGDAEEKFSRLFEHTPVASAAQLLTGFSRLVNGGISVTPHLLYGYWNQEGRHFEPFHQKLERTAALPATCKAILGLLKKSKAIGPGASVFVESLVGRKKNIVQGEMSGEDLSGATEFSSSDSSILSGENMVDLNIEVGRQVEYQAIMLGVAPVHRPTISFIVVLDGAVVDLAAPSPLRQMGHEIVRRMHRWATEEVLLPTAEVLASRQKEVFEKWRSVMQGKVDDGKPQFSKGKQSDIMPELNGYSLRKALQVLQPYGLHVKIVGSGTVVSQKPASGYKLKDRECLLELQVMH
ncbi:MAG: PASTA domain-containing protein [Proteobacteria bacterium]|nr:PASTA domain-containing protein [Pseudomonadota bacterium]MBU1717338.1 PASTA domain-containing protein [Pseudomonadota bacterium]